MTDIAVILPSGRYSIIPLGTIVSSMRTEHVDLYISLLDLVFNLLFMD